jgi:hypothetical protein
MTEVLFYVAGSPGSGQEWKRCQATGSEKMTHMQMAEYRNGVGGRRIARQLAKYPGGQDGREETTWLPRKPPRL